MSKDSMDRIEEQIEKLKEKALVRPLTNTEFAKLVGLMEELEFEVEKVIQFHRDHGRMNTAIEGTVLLERMKKERQLLVAKRAK